MSTPPSEVSSSFAATLADEPALSTSSASAAAVSRLSIPRIGVAADVIVLGVDPDGTMQTPASPTEVAWYRFSGRPGQAGNIVLAGHVDYLNYGAAVFYRLRDLQPGDEVIIETQDGARFTYRISSVEAYDDVPEAVARVTASTLTEVVTLITCGGVFNRSTGQYERRLVVRGERL